MELGGRVVSVGLRSTSPEREVLSSIPGRTPQKLPGLRTVTWSRVQRVDQEKHDWLGLLLRTVAELYPGNIEILAWKPAGR